MDVSPNVWCVLLLAILQPWMVLSVSCKYNEIRIVAIQPKQYNDIKHHILELYRYNPTELQSYVFKSQYWSIQYISQFWKSDLHSNPVSLHFRSSFSGWLTTIRFVWQKWLLDWPTPLPFRWKKLCMKNWLLAWQHATRTAIYFIERNRLWWEVCDITVLQSQLLV